MSDLLRRDHLSPSDIMGNHPCLVIIGTGLAFGFLVGRMILAHLCDEPKGLKTGMCMVSNLVVIVNVLTALTRLICGFIYVLQSLLYLPLAIANALTARLNDGVPLVDERLVLLGFCAYTVTLYLHFATTVIHEITNALGICCFRITRKEA
ncbi:hypothetical protein Ahy_A01g004045 isoform B [Arachis hypogaea]|uniref:Uncharacterized protein n=1 Tax=Arachis hypogaea TaxID=3818 RepID=A0A445EUQ5_ARAHY|nr:hypothetical protein Ahy_A01g004045 isoform B [Arachis hypogaea]